MQSCSYRAHDQILSHTQKHSTENSTENSIGTIRPSAAGKSFNCRMGAFPARQRESGQLRRSFIFERVSNNH
jgi:hypothetical protein